jgi:signal transduction histidine kinase
LETKLQNEEIDLAEDATLIRSQVARCQEILNKLSFRAETQFRETPETLELESTLQNLFIHEQGSVCVQVDENLKGKNVSLPEESLTLILQNLVQNAKRTGTKYPIELRAQRDGDGIHFTVRDQGPGMTPEQLKRVGDPFFTTKEVGEGIGLGLFLTRNLVEHWEGELDIESTIGVGTSVHVRLPIEAV